MYKEWEGRERNYGWYGPPCASLPYITVGVYEHNVMHATVYREWKIEEGRVWGSALSYIMCIIKVARCYCIQGVENGGREGEKEWGGDREREEEGCYASTLYTWTYMSLHT